MGLGPPMGKGRGDVVENVVAYDTYFSPQGGSPRIEDPIGDAVAEEALRIEDLKREVELGIEAPKKIDYLKITRAVAGRL